MTTVLISFFIIPITCNFIYALSCFILTGILDALENALKLKQPLSLYVCVFTILSWFIYMIYFGVE